MDASDQIANENYNKFVHFLESFSQKSLAFTEASLSSLKKALDEKIKEYKELSEKGKSITSLSEKLKSQINHQLAIMKADGLLDFNDERASMISDMMKDFKINKVKDIPKVLGEMDIFKEFLVKEHDRFLQMGKPESLKDGLKAKLDDFLPQKNKIILKSLKKTSFLDKAISNAAMKVASAPEKNPATVSKDISDGFVRTR